MKTYPDICPYCKTSKEDFLAGKCRTKSHKKKSGSKSWPRHIASCTRENGWTAEQRSAHAKKGADSQTFEQRSANAKKAKANMTPEARSEASRKGHLTMTPEQKQRWKERLSAVPTPIRLQAAQKALATLGEEGIKERSKKQQASMTTEKRREAARKRVENMGPEKRRQSALKTAATRRLNGTLGGAGEHIKRGVFYFFTLAGSGYMCGITKDIDLRGKDYERGSKKYRAPEKGCFEGFDFVSEELDYPFYPEQEVFRIARTRGYVVDGEVIEGASYDELVEMFEMAKASSEVRFSDLGGGSSKPAHPG